MPTIIDALQWTLGISRTEARRLVRAGAVYLWEIPAGYEYHEPVDRHTIRCVKTTDARSPAL